MMTLEQAKQVLDTIIQQVRMTRQDHALALQALNLLYSEAKEKQEVEKSGE